MKTTIAFYDVTESDRATYRAALDESCQLIFHEGSLTEKNVHLAQEAEIFSGRIYSPLPAELLRLMPRLRHIACRTTGFDHVDLAYAAEHQISLSTVPSYGEVTVAEYAFVLL